MQTHSPQHARPAPLTGAQRQRRFREKLRQELAALRAVKPSTHNERELLYRVHSLTAQLEKAARDAAALQQRIQALEAAKGEAQALRDAVQGALLKLTPAARCAAFSHLKTAGVNLEPDAKAPAPQAAPGARAGAYLIL